MDKQAYAYYIKYKDFYYDDAGNLVQVGIIPIYDDTYNIHS